MKIAKFLDSSPVFTLFAAYDEIVGDLQRQLAKEGVHFLQALILTGLFFEERPVRPSELAKVLRAQRSNLSHALRALERSGLVERGVLSGDARAYLFSLTRDGRKKVPKLIKILDSTQNQIENAPGGRRLIPALNLFVEIYKTSIGTSG